MRAVRFRTLLVPVITVDSAKWRLKLRALSLRLVNCLVSTCCSTKRRCNKHTTHYHITIGLTTLPATVVTPSINQFHDKTVAFLLANHLQTGQIHRYATPRRLALLVHDLAAKQADVTTDVKGPAKLIAQDADGNWTKAALGFSRSQGNTPDTLVFKTIKGVHYVYHTKAIKGKTAAEILPGLLHVLKGHTFPTHLLWGD